MRNDSSVDDLGEDPELFSPSKEQKYDIEDIIAKFDRETQLILIEGLKELIFFVLSSTDLK